MHHGLDQLDQGIDPYKVNQLQAMRWTKSAWNDIPPSVFANCWKHTGLLPNPNDSVSATEVNSNSDLDPVQAEVHTEFDRFIKTYDIAEPVEFINPAAEELDMHTILSDSEIIELYQDAQEVDEEQEAAENMSCRHMLVFPKKRKLLFWQKQLQFLNLMKMMGVGIHRQ
jgi:hypothetical protein